VTSVGPFSSSGAKKKFGYFNPRLDRYLHAKIVEEVAKSNGRLEWASTAVGAVT